MLDVVEISRAFIQGNPEYLPSSRELFIFLALVFWVFTYTISTSDRPLNGTWEWANGREIPSGNLRDEGLERHMRDRRRTGVDAGAVCQPGPAPSLTTSVGRLGSAPLGQKPQLHNRLRDWSFQPQQCRIIIGQPATLPP